MKIYTKTGDKGTTALFGGKRVPKNNAQISAYGTVDELSSFLGLALAYIPSDKNKTPIIAIQRDLYVIMGILAGAKQPIEQIETRVKELEQFIDKIEAGLPKLTRFILPQGGVISGHLHIVRTITRRAEREVVSLLGQEEYAVLNKDISIILMYINRLSDLMFVLARHYTEGDEYVT